MIFYENKVDQAISLSKEANCVLSLLRNWDTKSNKCQENDMYSTHHYHIQDIKDVYYKNVNMYWDYWKFPCHPVTDEWYKMRVSNTIISRYHYRKWSKAWKLCLCHFFITCASPACFSQLNKDWLPNCAQSYQPRYAHIENCYYNKIPEHYKYWIIIKLLDNNTPREYLYNIHVLVLAVMSTNNAELVEVNGYCVIAANCFTFFYICSIHTPKIRVTYCNQL